MNGPARAAQVEIRQNDNQGCRGLKGLPMTYLYATYDNHMITGGAHMRASNRLNPSQ